MNTEQEKILVDLAAEGPMHDGDVESMTGWFGVAEVTVDDVVRIAEEHDDEVMPDGQTVTAVPDVGTHMVTLDNDGTIMTMQATPHQAIRWFRACQQAYSEWLSATEGDV